MPTTKFGASTDWTAYFNNKGNFGLIHRYVRFFRYRLLHPSSDELLEDQTSPVNENKTGSTHNLMPIDAELIKKVDQLLDEIKIKVKSFEFDVGDTCDMLK